MQWLYSTGFAFAAMLPNSRIATWGEPSFVCARMQFILVEHLDADCRKLLWPCCNRWPTPIVRPRLLFEAQSIASSLRQDLERRQCNMDMRFLKFTNGSALVSVSYFAANVRHVLLHETFQASLLVTRKPYLSFFWSLERLKMTTTAELNSFILRSKKKGLYHHPIADWATYASSKLNPGFKRLGQQHFAGSKNLERGLFGSDCGMFDPSLLWVWISSQSRSQHAPCLVSLAGMRVDKLARRQLGAYLWFWFFAFGLQFLFCRQDATCFASWHDFTIHWNSPDHLNRWHENPPVPKVPRRDSLGADPIDSNNPLFTGAPSAGGAMFARNRPGRQKSVPWICTFCISAQHRPNAPFRSDMAATSGPASPLGSNFGPTWLEDDAAWPQLGPTWEQLRPKLRSIWLQSGGHSRPNQKSSKRLFSLVFSTLFSHRWRFDWSNVPHVVSPLGPTWCEPVTQSAPMLRHVLGLPRASHGFSLGSIWVALVVGTNFQLGPR